GVDTAKYQHPGGAPIDWAAVRASGVEFATVKATRGLNVTDEYLTTDLPAAHTAGLAASPYHFYTGTAANTGGAQADRFTAAARRLDDLADVAVHRRRHPRRNPGARDRGRLQRHPSRPRPIGQPMRTLLLSLVALAAAALFTPAQAQAATSCYGGAISLHYD